MGKYDKGIKALSNLIDNLPPGMTLPEAVEALWIMRDQKGLLPPAGENPKLDEIMGEMRPSEAATERRTLAEPFYRYCSKDLDTFEEFDNRLMAGSVINRLNKLANGNPGAERKRR
jgi:hypothetical protein